MITDLKKLWANHTWALGSWPKPTDEETKALLATLMPLSRFLWELGPPFYVFYKEISAVIGPNFYSLDPAPFHIGKLHKKLHSGEPVSDEELAFGIKEYTWAERALFELGDGFSLARSAIQRDLDMMRGWDASRKEKR